MEIYTTLEGLHIEDKTAVALGNFDGLHLGHRVVMEDAVRTATDPGMKSLCFTFSNHPFNFILQRPDDDPDAVKLICTEDEKIELVREMGFDILVNVPFDETVMKMKADEFFHDIIVQKLNAGYISIGFNYTYGARAEGRPEKLRDACREEGIGIRVHDAVIVQEQVVSSTLIRELIGKGDMETTAAMLGRPYSFAGSIMHGKKLGSAMGIPTANIPVPPRQMLPPDGVYFSRLAVGGKTYSSVSNLGLNPTVSDSSTRRIETFIFDFDSDVYGKNIIVYFDHFSRAERKFPDKESLFAQIEQDCRNAREYRF